MALANFYHPSLNSADTEVELSEAESSHASRARRLQIGQGVSLFNGIGGVADGVINNIERRKVRIGQLSFVQHEPPQQLITLACAQPKGDRLKTLVEMASQLGVSQLKLLNYERSNNRFSSNLLDKCQRWSVEACKQSHNPYLMAISAPTEFVGSEFLGQKLVLDAAGKRVDKIQLDHGDQITLFIGPEGGFSAAEQQWIEKRRIEKLSVGDHILRIETAAIAAVAVLQQHEYFS